MDTPIYDALLAKFVRKHGRKPGETPSRRPIGDALFKKLFFPPPSRWDGRP